MKMYFFFSRFFNQYLSFKAALKLIIKTVRYTWSENIRGSYETTYSLLYFLNGIK